MSTSALAQRTQEKLMERIKALRKLKENRKCFECLSKSPSCVDTTHNTFVCMTCGGILRMFNFRVKSISISSFAVSEVEALESGGNKVARKKWLAGFDGEHPPSGNTEQIKEFIRKKYEENAWVNRSGKTKRKSSNKPEPEPSEQDQTDDDENSEAAPTAPVERRKSGSNRPQTKTQSAAPPDLLDLNAIFSSQSASTAQAPNFGSSFPSQPNMQEAQHAQPFSSQTRSDWGGFTNPMFQNSYNQAPQQIAQQPPQQLGQSFPMDSFFGAAPSGGANQYSNAMPQAGYHPNSSPFGMTPSQQPQSTQMSHFQAMGQNMPMQQPQQQQADSNMSRIPFPQQMAGANGFSPAQSQPKLQSPFVPSAQSNSDPFADLLATQTMAPNMSSLPSNRGSVTGDDLFGNSNPPYNSQHPPQRNSLTSGITFGNANVALGGQQQPKRNSIPSDIVFGNASLEFGSPDSFDASNPFGPPPPVNSAPVQMGFYHNQSPNVNFGMDPPPANNRAYAQPAANMSPSPFYSQPASSVNQPIMASTQHYSQPIPMHQQQQQQQQPQFGQAQGFPQAFAPRPIEQFPFNNMPAQPNVPSYNMQQVPTTNTAVPDFFSKQRPVDSLDTDLNSNPFL